ncbi:MAG: DUF4357 domain-containing protein [Ruminobacter sp.]|nr:DUF4357 domain-containing protein [Ruminobacter sp.]
MRISKYCEDDKIKDFKTTEDLIISSSSYAASFVLDYAVSGPKYWKNKVGVSLKEIELTESELEEYDL